MLMFQRLLFVSPIVLAFSIVSPAQCETYPSRYLRLIVPYGAGGTVDSVARIAAAELSKELNQSVVVENRPGASSALGVGEVAKAKPDGYTLLFVDASIAVNPRLLGEKFPFDPLTNLKPVAKFATGQLVLITNPGVPAHDLAQLVKYAKENPDKLEYGSGATGTLTHLCPEMFKQAADVKIVRVPYKSAAPAISDLLGGVIQTMCVGVSGGAPIIENNSVRAFAITGSARSPRLPTVPTFAEAGVESLLLKRANSWFAIFASPGTPDPVVEVLNQAVSRALDNPQVEKLFSDLGLEASRGTPTELAKLVREDMDAWDELITKAGIKAE